MRCKRIISAVMAACMTATVFAAGVFAEEAEGGTGKYRSEKLNRLHFTEAVTVAQPFDQIVGLDCAIGKEDGVNVMYTTSSARPAVFNVFDLDNFKLLRYFELPGTASSWEHNIDKNGNVYIIATDKAKLFRYSPKTKEIEDLGSIDGQSAAYQSAFDDEGNLYIGTYPSGAVVKFDPKTKKFTSLGQTYPGHSYVRSLVYYKGFLYAGTIGTTDGLIVKINPETGEKTPIPVPIQEKYFTEVNNIYGQTLMGQYGLIYSAAGKGNNVWMVFDYENDRWMDTVVPKAAGTYGSPVKDGKVYFGADGVLKSIDINTLEIRDTSIKSTFNGRKYGWVDLKRNDEFNGNNILVTVAYSGCPIFINLEKGVIRTMSEARLKGGFISLQHVAADDNDNIYMGGYMGTKAAQYNTKTGELLYFPMGQTENIKQVGDKIYFGVYANGDLREFDPKEPVSKTNPKTLLTIKNDQDRPYIIDGADGKVIAGSVATYGKLGGALTIYDTETGEYEVFRNVVQDQSIVGLCMKDGFIYGSTTISGGLGIDPTETEAKMFVWDVAKKKKIREWTPDWPEGMPGPVKIIGDLEVGPDGLIWGATQGYVFAMEPVTCKIVKSQIIGSFNYAEGGHYWMPEFIRFHDNGLMYITGDSGVIMDPDTMEFIDLAPYTKYKSNIMDIDSEGNLYFGVMSMLRKVCVTENPITDCDKTKLYEALDGSVTMMVGRENAISGGIITQIDSDNAAVRPVMSGDRVLLPLRFVGESLNAEVGWDDQTNTASLTFGDQTISAAIGEKSITVNGDKKEIDTAAETIQDRTYLPLRAVAEACNKEVTWYDSGIIIIGDKKYELNEEMQGKAVSYFKNYAPLDYVAKLEEKKHEEALAEEELLMADKPLVEIKNADFELDPIDGEIPGWEAISKERDGISGTISSDKSYKGEKSFYLEDTLTDARYGIRSKAFKISRNKTYVLKTKLYIDEGRTSIGLKFYDDNLSEMNTVYENVTSGQGAWQNVTLRTGVPEGARYARIEFVCSELWTTKAYFDNVLLYTEE